MIHLTQRVEEIGYRLSESNPTRCERPRPLLGMRLHESGSYAINDRPKALALFGFAQGVAIQRVTRGGAAAQAGLAAGDIILGSGAITFDTYRTDLIKSAASYDRVEAIERIIEDQIMAGEVSLTVRKQDGTAETVKLPDRRGCVSRFLVTQDTMPTAWSDAFGLEITSGLILLVESDDALAFGIAHEMAHIILCHACQQKSKLLAKFGIGSKSWKAAELSADATALELMKSAQYEPQGAIDFFLKLLHSGRGKASGTHPGASERIAALKAHWLQRTE